MIKITKMNINLFLSIPSKYWINYFDIIICFWFTIIQEKNDIQYEHIFFNIYMCSIRLQSKSFHNNYNVSFL